MNTTEHNALQLAEKLEQLKKSESDLITERDYRDEIIDHMADTVLGTDRAVPDRTRSSGGPLFRRGRMELFQGEVRGQ